jgi:hypothetical protein
LFQDRCSFPAPSDFGPPARGGQVPKLRLAGYWTGFNSEDKASRYVRPSRIDSEHVQPPAAAGLREWRNILKMGSTLPVLVLLTLVVTACGGAPSGLTPTQMLATPTPGRLVSSTSRPTGPQPLTPTSTATIRTSPSPTLDAKPAPLIEAPLAERGPNASPKPDTGAPGVGSAPTPYSGPGPRPTPVSSSPAAGVMRIPACPVDIKAPLFITPPMASGDYLAFRPLGWTSPPTHVFPAKHSNFALALPGQAPPHKPV